MSSDINIIYDMARKAQKAAERSGADEVEVFGLMASSVNVDIQLDRIDLAKESFSKGIGVKAIVNGAVGFSSTNDPARIIDAAKSATSSARVRHSDPDWTGLPQACEYRAVNGIHDPRIANIDVETCIDLTMKMIDGAVSLDGARPTSGKFTCLGSDYVILNSNGVEVKEASSIIPATFSSTLSLISPAVAAAITTTWKSLSSSTSRLCRALCSVPSSSRGVGWSYTASPALPPSLLSRAQYDGITIQTFKGPPPFPILLSHLLLSHYLQA